MDTPQRTYLSYMLRLWRDDSGEKIVWRASLESVQTGERRHFVDEDHLFADLAQQLGLPARSAHCE
jgi:hypothetical protein